MKVFLNQDSFDFRVLLAIALVFSYFILPSPALAQVPDPGAIREQSLDTLKFHQLQKQLEEKEKKKAAPKEDAIVDETVETEKPLPEAEGPRIRVNKIQVSPPSKILSEKELQDITRPLEKSEVTIKDLYGAVGAINALYKKKGAIAAQAILPPQKVEKGIVQIQLIEARVGDVSVENNQSTREGYIKDGVDIQVGDLVQLSDLENNIFFFNTVNDIDVRAVLKPGGDFGTTNYIIKVKEPPKYQFVLFADNAGRKDVGRERVGFSFTNRSLFGFRDSLTLGGFVGIGNSEVHSNTLDDIFGTRAAFASYNFPINSYGTRLSVNYDLSNIVIIAGQTEALNVEGKSENMGLQVRHPFVVRPRFQLNGFFGGNVKNSETDFDKVTLLRQEVKTLSFGFEMQATFAHSSIYTRQVYTDSLDERFGDTNFIKYNGEIGLTSVHSNNIVTIMRVKGQWTDNMILPSAEQFQVGGMSTVRGYREGFLIGDRGYFFSMEASLPVLPSDWTSGGNPFEQKIRAMIFVDHGAAFPFTPPGQHITKDDFLTSVGGGLIFNFSKIMNAKILVGVPLAKRIGETSLRDPRIHFIAQFFPF
jgi:hemolysin activation/secretion protein